MIPFSRADRVGGLIQKVLSDILKKNIRDPRLKMATITKSATIKGFSSAHGFIKRALAHELDLKYMPDIKFFYDESLEYGAHIDELIESTKSENGSNHSTY
jgi:ribosome-binding factor A